MQIPVCYILYFTFCTELVFPCLGVVQSKEVIDGVLSVRVSGNTPGILQYCPGLTFSCLVRQ